MRLRLVTTTMTLVVAGGLVTAHPAASGAPDGPKTIPIVVLDNSSGIAATDLAQAQGIAVRVLGRIGVRLEWLTREEFFRGQPVDVDAAKARYRSMIYLVVANKTDADAGHSNSSVMGTAQGRVIWAFPTRLTERARRANVSIADVFGHVIAHELGHILLGPGAHAASGIMSATLDLVRVGTGGLWFTASEARTIHETLARR